MKIRKCLLVILFSVFVSIGNCLGDCLPPVEIDINDIPFHVNPLNPNLKIIGYRIIEPNTIFEPNSSVTLEFTICDPNVVTWAGSGEPTGIIIEPNDWQSYTKYEGSQAHYYATMRWKKNNQGLCDIFSFAFVTKECRKNLDCYNSRQWWCILFYHSEQRLVNFLDLVTLANAWLSTPGSSNWDPNCDISIPADYVIDIQDLAVLTDNWLASVF